MFTYAAMDIPKIHFLLIVSTACWHHLPGVTSLAPETYMTEKKCTNCCGNCPHAITEYIIYDKHDPDGFEIVRTCGKDKENADYQNSDRADGQR